MSFLTPARLQDASRVFRGIALVAAKAAADSPALRRAGQGDLNNAVKEAMKSISIQTKQIAEILDTTSREQTGVPMEHHMQRSRDAAENVASIISDRTQVVFQEGQQAAQAAVQQPRAIFDNLAYEGRRMAEGASRNLQQTAESTRGAFDNAAQQGQEAAQRAAPQGFQDAAADAQSMAQNLSRGAEQTAQGVAAASPQTQGSTRSIILDFSGGTGTATTSSGKLSTEAVAAARSQAEPASSQLPTSDADSRGQSMYATSEAGSLGAETSVPESSASVPSSASATASDTVSSSQAAKPAVDKSFRAAEAAEPVKSHTELASESDAALGSKQGPSHSAHEVLRSHSESGDFHDIETAKPAAPHQNEEKAATEAEDLLAEAKALSEKEAQVSGQEKAQVQAKKEEVKRKLKERRVPSSAIGRVAGFAQLGASLVYGTMADSVSSYFGGQKPQEGNRYMTERNAERLADALCRMRGAALKLGQMISIQDESVLPPQLAAAFERVRAGADVMPRKQLHKVLSAELGSEWRSKVANFEDEPLAAASIGQVHGATLHDGRRVVMKIQYPGVARSIESDVDNLLRIISIANILPKGLYVENAAKVAKKELKLECDYVYEARCQTKFVELIEEDADFQAIMHVPKVIPELCSHSVLTSEWVPGVHIDKVAEMSQKIRDAVGTLLLQLTLKELFEWRFMQTDPNWGNFLYDQSSAKLNLIDFGAAREFPSKFVDNYLSMVKACAERDREGVIDYSTRLGFLTGDESKVMLDAHSNAGFVVGTPFSDPGLYDFASHSSLTKQVSQLGAVMLKHRLTPPPEESYSLHRKLSGAFLACIKLRAKVPCHELFFSAYEKHKWGHEGLSKEDLPDLKVATG